MSFAPDPDAPAVSDFSPPFAEREQGLSGLEDIPAYPGGQLPQRDCVQAGALCWTETVAAYGYLATAESDGTVTGSGRLHDDDYTFDPEIGWGGGGFPPTSAFANKFPITGKLSTVNGRPAITLVFFTLPAESACMWRCRAFLGKTPHSQAR